MNTIKPKATVSVWLSPTITLSGKSNNSINTGYIQSSKDMPIDSFTMHSTVQSLLNRLHRPGLISTCATINCSLDYRFSKNNKSQNVIICNEVDADTVKQLLVKKFGQVWVVNLKQLESVVTYIEAVSTAITADVMISSTITEAVNSLYIRALGEPDIQQNTNSQGFKDTQVVMFVEPPMALPMNILDRKGITFSLVTEEYEENNIVKVLSDSCSNLEKLFSFGCLACPKLETCASHLVNADMRTNVSSKSLKGALGPIVDIIPSEASHSLVNNKYKFKSFRLDPDEKRKGWSQPNTSIKVFNCFLSKENEQIIEERVEILTKHKEAKQALAQYTSKCENCVFNSSCNQAIKNIKSNTLEKVEILQSACIGPVTKLNVGKEVKASTIIESMIGSNYYASHGDYLLSSGSSNMDYTHITRDIIYSVDDYIKTSMRALQIWGGYLSESFCLKKESNTSDAIVVGFLPKKTVDLIAGNTKNDAQRKRNDRPSYSIGEHGPWTLSRTLLINMPSSIDIIESVYGVSDLYAILSNICTGGTVAVPVNQLKPNPVSKRISKSVAEKHLYSVLLSVFLETDKRYVGSFASTKIFCSAIRHRHTVDNNANKSLFVQGFWRSRTKIISSPEVVSNNHYVNLANNIGFNSINVDSCISLRIMRAIKEFL
jgi:hypothetical protein